MKILGSSTLAVAALLLAAVPASADDTPRGGGGIGQARSTLDSGGFGDTADGRASEHRNLVKMGEPGAISDLVNNLTNPQPN
ncbi:hypothetical protein ACFWBF_24485 [Streptomyces sp. NPDC060028]|uniref:hypothetical protein n=1 Tax=Streptomyces sp. NPDC060028 TaxID=3347041 RepID=UPI0036ADFE99